MEQRTGDQERQGGADAAGEGHDYGSPEQPEQGAAEQGHHQGAGNRKRGHDYVNGKINQRRQGEIFPCERLQGAQLGLHEFKAYVALQVEQEPRTQDSGDKNYYQKSCFFHLFTLGSETARLMGHRSKCGAGDRIWYVSLRNAEAQVNAALI